MHKFKRAYDFYALPEHERRSYVGQQFLAIDHPDYEFFVIGLVEGEFNYGSRQGVLYIFPPRKDTYAKSPDFGQLWWKIGVFSPDDLDKSIEFSGDAECKLFSKVRGFLREANPILLNTTYHDALEFVRQEFNCGTHSD